MTSTYIDEILRNTGISPVFYQKHNIFTALCECTIHISSSENINDVMVTGSFSLVVLLFSKGFITFTNDAKVELRLFFFLSEKHLLQLYGGS